MSSPLAETTQPAARFVTGLFKDPQQAHDAFEQLVATSFDPHEVSVLRVVDGVLEGVPVDHKSGVPAGLATGAVLGVGLAGAIALTGGVGVSFLAAGPILAALQGTFLGAAGGGLLGALAGLAFWSDEPELEAELGPGAVFLGVSTEGERARAARQTLLDAGAVRIFG
jgi:hypothetical protein